MFRAIFLSSLLLIITSSSSAEDIPSRTHRNQSKIDNEGTSLEAAIVIQNIRDYDSCPDQKCVTKAHEANLGQEIEHIEQIAGEMFKDWVPLGNQLLHNGNKHYDEISFSLIASNEEKKLYFDITEPINSYLARLQKNDIPIVETAAETGTKPVTGPVIKKPSTRTIEPFVNDGKTIDSAIIIHNGDDVLPEQYASLERLLGPRSQIWEPADDSFIHQDKAVYDKLTVTIDPAKEKQTVYFDITARHRRLDEEFWKKE